MNALDAASILGPDGVIARRLPGYESRPQQVEMAGEVARAIDSKRHLIVEAGTGVGKSFAYLVPAILAAEQGLKVLVATHTISLQEQLLRKDVPFLRAVMPQEFSAVLVKGRSNYVSLRRLEASARRADASFARIDHLNQLAEIAIWARATDDGSLSDLRSRPSPEVWDAVESDYGNCMGKSCQRFRQCFYYRAMRRAYNANLLIANHSLAMVDLQLRQNGAALLPDYDVAIFDEAHNLQGVAAQHLGLRIASGAVIKLLNRLYNERTAKGLLAYFGDNAAIQQARNTLSAADDFFDEVADWRVRRAPPNGRARAATGIANTLGEELLKLATALDRIANSIQEPEQRIEYDSAAERCKSFAIGLQSWLSHSLDDAVYWVDVDPKDSRRVTLAGAPLNVGPMMRQLLFERGPTCILTSATLSTGTPPDFRFVAQNLGLADPITRTVGSPFDFANQVVLHLVKNLPDPATQSDAYERAAIAAIPHFIEMTHGKAFVLFTSNRMMHAATTALRSWFSERRIKLLSQSDGTPRTQMIEAFKADVDSVIFGVSSFWQGVDVPGEALSNVIITRLPFSVPDDPVNEARRESVERDGGNYFRDHSLPEAILTLKQGFGRLIRSRGDKGIVVILDPRVLTKYYGRQFLAALPDCPRKIESLTVAT